MAGLLLPSPAPPTPVVIRLPDPVPEVWADRVARQWLVVHSSCVRSRRSLAAPFAKPVTTLRPVREVDAYPRAVYEVRAYFEVGFFRPFCEVGDLHS